MRREAHFQAHPNLAPTPAPVRWVGMRIERGIDRDRVKAIAITAVLQGALGYGLIVGLAPHFTPPVQEQSDVVALLPLPPDPPPKKQPPPNPRDSARPEGAAAPPNLRSQATPIVAPPPLVPIPIPPPVVAAPVANTGTQASQGAAEIAGPGTGAGGIGNGTGSGEAGDGDGGGGTPPRFLRGRIRNSDYPAAAGEGGNSGTVGVKYLVWTDGRVVDCEITRSSGNKLLDDTTCRLIKERFRFRPSRDRSGKPVPAGIIENHSWIIEQLPPEEQPAEEPRPEKQPKRRERR